MATLTTSEVDSIRKRIGDFKATTAGKTDLTTPEIQAEWDRANGHSSEKSAYLAYFYMLELRYGIWINATDTETAQGSKSQSQKVANIRSLLDYYAQKAGVPEFTLPTQAGTLDMGLDQDDPLTGEDLDENA